MNEALLAETAQTRLSQARDFNRLNRLDEARAGYSEAEDLYARLDDNRGRSRAWAGLAKVYGKQKEFTRSAEAFARSAHFAALAGWADKEIEGYYNEGLTWQQLGLKGADLVLVNRAIEAFDKGLAAARQANDRASEGVLLISVGLACAWSKDDDRAIPYLREAAEFALDNVDFDTSFSVLSTLGVIYSNRNQATEGIPYLERALELAKAAEGDLVAVADTFANLGVAYEKAGRLDDAIEATDTWREILHVSGDVKASTAAAMVRRLQDKARLTQK